MAWVEWRARPRGPTVPRRPSGALGQRGPLGPAPLRYGPPAARGGERAGLRGRPLIVAPVPRVPERALQPRARARPQRSHRGHRGSQTSVLVTTLSGAIPLRPWAVHGGSDWLLNHRSVLCDVALPNSPAAVWGSRGMRGSW